MFIIFAVEETGSIQSVMRKLEASFLYLFSNVISVTIMDIFICTSYIQMTIILNNTYKLQVCTNSTLVNLSCFKQG